jgi:hypothetical protein
MVDADTLSPRYVFPAEWRGVARGVRTSYAAPPLQVEQILAVARHLGDLRERVVFVGGMVCDRLVTDPAAAPARPTDDVDVIVDSAR